jgi:hypothetical protein
LVSSSGFIHHQERNTIHGSVLDVVMKRKLQIPELNITPSVSFYIAMSSYISQIDMRSFVGRRQNYLL